MATTPASGYSGTPLAKKLGIKEGMVVVVLGAPDNYVELLGTIPSAVEFTSRRSSRADIVHTFSSKASSVQKELLRFRKTMRPDSTIWVSWPKKASKVHTDVTEDTIRALAPPLGLVDVKVCAVSEIWSGLKLVLRKSHRTHVA